MAIPLRVLLLEDLPSDAQLVLFELRQAGFEPVWTRVETEQDFLAHLEPAPEIILADFNLPQFDAPRALQLTRQRGLDVPFLVVSGSIGEDVAVDVMLQGADDYLLKDRLSRLGTAVKRALEQKRLRDEKHAAEDARRSAETLFRNSIEQSLVGMAIIQDDKYVYVNPKLAEIFGYTQTQVLALSSWLDLVAEEDRDRVSENLRRRLNNEVPTDQYEFRGLRKDGTVIDVEVRGNRTELRGKPAVIGILNDVTERKRLERRVLAEHAVGRVLAASPALEEATPRILQAICESLEWDFGTLWRLSPEDRVLRCVETWRRPTLDADELDEFTRKTSCPTGVGIPGRILASGRPAWIPDVSQDAKALRGPYATKIGLRGAIGFPIVLGDQVLGVLDFFSRDVAQPDEDLLRTMSAIGSQIGQFIERKRAEEGLRQAQKRLQHVVASSPAILYILTLEGASIRLAWVSDNLPNMMGYSVEDAYAPQWWQERLHPDEAEGVIALIDHELFAQGQVANEYRFRHQNGEYRWIRDEMRLLHDSSGRPYEIVGSWSEITQQKQLEEQFRQSQKMEAIGKLAGGIAHDFNNLLTVISGYSEIILDSLHQQDPLHEPIEQIKKAGERAAALTRQLLAFSRKQVLAPVVIDLNALLADMEKMLHRLLGEDVELVIHPAPDLWKVTADVGQMEQVVMNLSVNARDAMPQGGQLTIETANVELDEAYVKTHPEVRAGRHVLLTVSDNGVGMEKEILSKIFEPFFTTKELHKGTGLGLSTVYGIIKQSGGHIEVVSEPGTGTTFKVHVPSGRQGAVSSTTRLGIQSRPHGSETILLVEDEEGVRSLAKMVLQRNGYLVLEAKDGEEALQVSQRSANKIHLLLTDVVMPQMSGRQLAERLLQTQPKLKVLYMSGYNDDATLRHGVLSRDTPFIQKPFATEVLVERVREMMEKTSL